MAKCKDCDNIIILENRGSGKCSNCHGSGTKNTITNDISGADTKCSKCKGTGTCSTCAGTGKIASAATNNAVPKVAHLFPSTILTSDLENDWYGLCSSSDFIHESTVEQYTTQLKATRKQAAIAVGLSDFTGHACSKCGSRGQFKIHFLGRLRHPECGANWYTNPGAYTMYQIKQIFHSGIRAGGTMKDDADRKGDRSGGIINAIFGFLFVAAFRGALAIILIPIQVIASLIQAKPTPGPDVSQASAAAYGTKSTGK
jgi:hypothetical protein